MDIRKSCCVPNCTQECPKIYYFPIHDTQLLKQWITNVGNPTVKSSLPSKIYKEFGVCERHFTPDCIVPESLGTRLKTTAIPTLFLPTSEEIDLIQNEPPVEVVVYKKKAKNPKKESVNISTTFIHICNLCLSQGKLQNLENSELRAAINLLETVLDYKIPDTICETCIKEIKQIELFIQKCKHSHNILTQIKQQCDKLEPQNDVEIELVESEEVASNVEREPTTVDLVDNDFIISDDVLQLSKIEYITCTFDESNQNSVKLPPKKTCKNCGEAVVTLKDHYKTSKDCKPQSVKKNATVENLNETVDNLDNRTSNCKVCKNCGEVITTMVEHYKTHKYCRPKTTCPTCGKSVLKRRLNRHLLLHDYKEESRFMCHICSKMFKYEVNLKRHLQLHETPKHFICEICGNGYSTKLHLDDHRYTHTGLKPYSCTYCDKKFAHRKTCKLHEETHLNGLEPQSNSPVVCGFCHQEFVHERALKLHIVVHDENRTFACGICKKTFSTKKLLIAHSELHYNDKPFLCEHCHKRFKDKGCLSAHLRSHTGEQPFLCTECPKRFGQISHLNYHMKLHRGEKPFVCEYCKKSFTLKGNLTVHMRLHTGERPYVCHVCKEGFRDASFRKRHVIAKHGVEQVEFIGINDANKTLFGE